MSATEDRRHTRQIPADGLLAVRVAVAMLVPLIAALAVLGGLGSYATIERAAEPYFGRLAPIVPIGMDLGVLVLLAWDLLLEHLDLAWPVLRWIAWAYIGGTVVVNVSAAGGRVVGMVMHAAMPVLFIAVMEGVRHLIRTRAGLAGGRRIEGIPFARWMLAPWSTATLWRRMVLWHVVAYRDGLALEYGRQRQVSRLQKAYGRWAWRWRAPAAERLALRLYGARPLTPDVQDWRDDEPSPQEMRKTPPAPPRTRRHPHR